MTMRIRKEELISYLRLLADDLERGELVSEYGVIEEWYNCDCIAGNKRFSIIYGPKKRQIGERQC